MCVWCVVVFVFLSFFLNGVWPYYVAGNRHIRATGQGQGQGENAHNHNVFYIVHICSCRDPKKPQKISLVS